MSIRISDVELVVELLKEAIEQPIGARNRVAERHAIQKSVLTDLVKRTENYFGTSIFEGKQRLLPTKSGQILAMDGGLILQHMQELRVKMLNV